MTNKGNRIRGKFTRSTLEHMINNTGQIQIEATGSIKSVALAEDMPVTTIHGQITLPLNVNGDEVSHSLVSDGGDTGDGNMFWNYVYSPALGSFQLEPVEEQG